MKVTEEQNATAATARYPGVPAAMDGTAAVVAMETAAGEAAGAYPITPSTQMGEGWALAAAEGRPNVNGRRLIFFEPEGEHAAAGVTAGLSMVGLRSTNFSSGQGIAYMHESLYAAVGKRLTYVLNMACRAMTKHALNVHAGHDDYHAIDDTGFFQLFAKNAQGAADLNLIAHRIAELALNPGICAQDGFLTSHVIESVLLPERDLIREYLGSPDDLIDSPTPAQRLVFGEKRRRIPEMFDLDNPAMLGVVQNQDSYAQGVASQRPFFFDHIAAIADQAMAEYAELTGRCYRRALGYRAADAEYLIVGQGSVVENAEAVADYLHETRGLAVGVVDVTMFRPFPADLLVPLLAGKKAVVVLERLDQPLAADAPLLREIRSALGRAVENQRADREGDDGVAAVPHPGIPAVAPAAVPDFYSGSFGMGSRDLQPGDLIAAVENMLPAGHHRRRFYLGVEFVRKGRVPERLAEWQEKVLEAYPGVADLALEPAAEPDSGEGEAGPLSLLPEGSLAVRIHSVGGWGAITMGKNLTMTLFELLGMNVKSNPKYGSEKKGQPTTFYGVFAHEPVRVNCELRHVDVVLSPDPNVFRHSNPLAGLAPGGTFVIQATEGGQTLWETFPAWAQKIVRDRGLRVFHLDGFKIARDETDAPDLQFRMQGAAFQGAFFEASPVMERESLDEKVLFATIHAQLEKKFGRRGKDIVEDNFRVIRRGFEEVSELDWRALEDGRAETAAAHEIEPPWYLDPVVAERAEALAAAHPIADPYRFMHQVCSLYREGADPIADPFAALSAIPAATGIFRDMTNIRFEAPQLLADKCTGCGQCWTQCPDAAIPGLVVEVEQMIRSAVEDWGANGGPSEAMRKLVAPLAKEARRLLREEDYSSFGATVARAYRALTPKLELSAPERAALEGELDGVVERLAEFPLARTAPFFTVPERRQEGSGGLLAITVNPYACKGCNLCVEVCPDDALYSATQTDSLVDTLRRNWKRWEALPDTPDRFLQVSDLEEGVGVLHTLLLKKKTYHSMVGGDGSCMGCGEKTGMHLVVATVEAAIAPRVAAFVAKLEGLIGRLEDKGNELLTMSADLSDVAEAGELHLDLSLDLAVTEENRGRLERISKALKTVKDLHWRYTEGPTGRGRAALGISNSTGCSSVWGSTYPYNPYPYPWTNHLFQDAPSVAIGLFEGIMRKMADGFAAVRVAELELDDAYDSEVHGPFFQAFDWHALSDEEFRLCPPILVVGGDGAMLDIGFQNVSRLLASGKPLRVVVLDTQVYSNTGGQACTSGFKGQVSDMAAYGHAHHGKEENRKEMGLIAMAHRGAFVVQTSQALPAHLVGGVLRALVSRRPAVINIYTPCQAEHGLPDSASAHAAKLALEGRAFPFLTYDPDAGTTVSERLSLEGNPAPEETWPTYELDYVDDDGAPQSLTVPLTTADWAATEPRFAKHFRRIPRLEWTDGPGSDQVPFAEYLELSAEERRGKTAFLWVKEEGEKLGRVAVAPEMATLAEERLDLWDELRELAGVKVPERVRVRIEAPLEERLERELAQLKEEYEMKLAQLKEQYPARITRRIAEALVGGQAGGGRLAALLGGSAAAPAFAPERPAAPRPVAVPASAPAPVAPVAAAEPEAVAEAPTEVEGLDPWIETALCTTCNECTQINPKIFAYNEDKQAYIKNPKGGPFSDIVKAAERCTAKIIHPGSPLNPKEPDLDKWIQRAESYQ